MDTKGSSFELPGFRFKPTEEELLGFYLKNMVYDNKLYLDVIGLLDIYRHAPWDLPGLSRIGEREWYFFVPRDRKHGHGGRPNRTTEHGFWKATGSDRKVVTLSEPKRVIGLRKTLVFYKGRAPRGCRTDWVMNEYRLPDNCVSHKDIVLCKIYRKATSLKELEERAAKEEAMEKSTTIAISFPTSPHSSSNNGTAFFNSVDVDQIDDLLPPIFMSNNYHTKTLKEEKLQENVMFSNCKVGTPNNVKLPFGKDGLELQVPKLGLDWAQDPIFSLSRSPWFENLLNFSSPTLMSQFLST